MYRTNRTDWCGGDALLLYSRGILFEIRPTYRGFPKSLSKDVRIFPRLGQCRLLQYPLQFIIRQSYSESLTAALNKPQVKTRERGLLKLASKEYREMVHQLYSVFGVGGVTKVVVERKGKLVGIW
jgi:hypothetical protein